MRNVHDIPVHAGPAGSGGNVGAGVPGPAGVRPPFRRPLNGPDRQLVQGLAAVRRTARAGTDTVGISPRAFTLVEMLAVIFILAIVVAVVVGVAGHVIHRSNVERTKATMAVAMQAVEAYRDATGHYPVENTGGTGEEGKRRARAAELYRNLMTVAKCKEVLSALEKDAIITIPEGPVIADAFGQYMDYRERAARGGGPLLESAGPNRVFGTEDFPTEENTKKRADNIFSDNR